MQSSGSVTQCFHQLQAGDADAAKRLWDFYFQRLVRLASKKFGGKSNPMYDEEDAAISAFQSFCTYAHRNQSDDLDRNRLWRLMATITVRKVCDSIVYQGRQKRSPQNNGVQQISLDAPSSKAQVVYREPDPEMAVELDEQMNALLESLVQPELKQIAVMKLEGYTNEEIATRLARGLSTIERKLRVIRQIWKNEFTRGADV